MADEPFVDAHVHFWDHSVAGLHWPWLEPGFSHRMLQGTAALDAPRYTAPEFLAEAASTGVAGVIHVQAVGDVEDPALETAWLQSMADEHGLPSGIVGSCTVGSPGAADLVRRHRRHRQFCGVRDITSSKHLDPDASVDALDLLATMRLSIEARRHHEEFAVLADIARRWPSLTVVLSHACLPVERTDAARRGWTAAAQQLAPHQNVVCKISAVAGASDPAWTVASIRPWIRACFDVFGPDRCLFGTNWPVDRLFGTYEQVVTAYREIAAELDPDGREAVFHGTATRVYQLDQPDDHDLVDTAPTRTAHLPEER
jgi:predicted TIM-barrel fold metal-dependent hydrolase